MDTDLMDTDLMDTDLSARWADHVAPLRPPPAVAAKTWEDLAARYGRPGRHYHTLAHIRQVLTTVDELARAGEPHDDLGVVRWAAWYHDAVYEPGSATNEADSADLADRALSGLGLDVQRRKAVAKLIRATADHVPHSPDARILLDADLAILAAPPQAYGSYVSRIRAEYHMVPPEAWRAGRSAFLRQMLARPSIFATSTARREAEETARANLSAELSQLNA